MTPSARPGTPDGGQPQDTTSAGSDASAPADTATGGRSGSKLRTAGRWLGGCFVVGSFAFWAWAFSPWARSENPGRLDDRDFVQWADQRCARARTAIDDLPSAREASSWTDRAAQVDRGTDEVQELVADLRLHATGSLTVSSEAEGPPDAELVSAWLDDWDQYISDRRDHSERLRSATDDTPDRELRFLLLDMTEGSTYTERMDGFARLNDMDNCQIPGDV